MPLESVSEPKGDIRRLRGCVSHQRGVSAEEQVQRHYERSGARCLARRWRGKGGEIDLIFALGEDVVFVEVKASKTHAQAAEALRPKQVMRLCKSAEEYIGTLPAGSLTPMRMDVALVDGQGMVEILENALMIA